MRPRDPKIALADIIRAGEAILGFIRDRTFAEYEADLQLSSAVERQFEVIGEALNRLLRSNPDFAERLPDVSRVIAFRNVLAHGYDSVSNALVWSLANEKLPSLLDQVRLLLNDGAAAD